MLKKLPWRVMAFGCLVGVLSGLLAVAIELVQGQICEYNQATEHEDCTTYSLFPFLLKTFNDYGVAITALATVAIGFFTLTLKLSTDKLWEAGENQRRLYEDTAERQLRAYVHITKASFSNLRGDAEFFIEYKNCGQTPAYKMRAWNTLKNLPYPNDNVFNREESQVTIALGTLGPNNTQHFPKASPRVLTALELAAIEKGESAIYLWGAIIYVDAFKNERTTNFRKIIGGPNGISRYGLMSNCPDGNDAD